MRNQLRNLGIIFSALLVLTIGTLVYAASSRVTSGYFYKDFKGNVINVAASLKFEDGSTPPIVSPYTTAITDTPKAIKVPFNAVVCVLRINQAGRVGTGNLTGTGTGNGYKCVSANGDYVYPCVGITEIKLRAEVAGTPITKLDYQFEVLNADAN